MTLEVWQLKRVLWSAIDEEYAFDVLTIIGHWLPEQALLSS